MIQKLRIDGIYDKRTLQHLKSLGLKDFCFDFSPRSFNFIQEYVFLEQILNLLDESDRIFLHFTRSNDPMVMKLILDLKKNGQSLKNVYFEFDEWSEEVSPIDFENNYLINFSKDCDAAKLIGKNFKGFIFSFNFFGDLHSSKLLNNFASNFYTRYQSRLAEESLLLLKIDWNDNLIPSLFELFEFDLISFPINSKIEICYRNVDLKKLSNEMQILQKSNYIFHEL
ncbi:MAG: hypothetical protein Q7U04_11330 [Bacteriovorax sp.]|nr:hypothetical protein [Bacteriovorax sp.]